MIANCEQIKVEIRSASSQLEEKPRVPMEGLVAADTDPDRGLNRWIRTDEIVFESTQFRERPICRLVCRDALSSGREPAIGTAGEERYAEPALGFSKAMTHCRLRDSQLASGRGHRSVVDDCDDGLVVADVQPQWNRHPSILCASPIMNNFD
jgi:hypothetical protein